MNKPFLPVAAGELSKGAAWVLCLLLAAGAQGVCAAHACMQPCACWCGPASMQFRPVHAPALPLAPPLGRAGGVAITATNFGTLITSLYSFGLFLGTIYSVPPLRLKRSAVAAFLIIATGAAGRGSCEGAAAVAWGSAHGATPATARLLSPSRPAPPPTLAPHSARLPAQLRCVPRRARCAGPALCLEPIHHVRPCGGCAARCFVTRAPAPAVLATPSRPSGASPNAPTRPRRSRRSFITCFVSLFATVIAITKDLPDIEGDRQFGIETFATRIGVRCVLGAARVGQTGVQGVHVRLDTAGRARARALAPPTRRPPAPAPSPSPSKHAATLRSWAAACCWPTTRPPSRWPCAAARCGTPGPWPVATRCWRWCCCGRRCAWTRLGTASRPSRTTTAPSGG